MFILYTCKGDMGGRLLRSLHFNQGSRFSAWIEIFNNPTPFTKSLLKGPFYPHGKEIWGGGRLLRSLHVNQVRFFAWIEIFDNQNHSQNHWLKVHFFHMDRRYGDRLLRSLHFNQGSRFSAWIEIFNNPKPFTKSLL